MLLEIKQLIFVGDDYLKIQSKKIESNMFREKVRIKGIAQGHPMQRGILFVTSSAHVFSRATSHFVSRKENLSAIPINEENFTETKNYGQRKENKEKIAGVEVPLEGAWPQIALRVKVGPVVHDGAQR